MDSGAARAPETQFAKSFCFFFFGKRRLLLPCLTPQAAARFTTAPDARACYAAAMKRLLLAALLPVLLVPAAWLAAEWRLQQAAQDWAAARGREGWSVRSGPVAWAGFPLEAALVFPDLALSSPPEPAGASPGWLEWSVPRLELRVSPLHPLTLLLLPHGPQRLRLARLPALAAEAQDARIALPLRPAPGDAAEAAATALRLGPPGGPQAAAGALSLSLALHPGAARDDAAATFRLGAADVSLPGLPAPLRSLSLAGAVEGPLSPRPTPAAAAAAWRDGGGRIVLQRLDADWGSLSASGTATLTLDAALQPAATATLRLSGYDAALDSLAAAGTIGSGTARVARAVLGLMAQPGGGVSLPVAWRDGVVAAGRIPLLRTPAVQWDLGGSEARPGALSPMLKGGDPAKGEPLESLTK